MNVNILAFIISLILTVIICFLIESPKINVNMNLQRKDIIIDNNIVVNAFKSQYIINNKNKILTLNMVRNSNENKWQLEIPKINLIAEIAEGTGEKILNKYIGHFEETQKLNGNIGLAAHNRGYPVNYFNRLKELNIGDEIIYKYFNDYKIYKVISKMIINDTNWEVLENTSDNRLTLITCVENEPTKRRCVQAVEKII